MRESLLPVFCVQNQIFPPGLLYLLIFRTTPVSKEAQRSSSIFSSFSTFYISNYQIIFMGKWARLICCRSVLMLCLKRHEGGQGPYLSACVQKPQPSQQPAGRPRRHQAARSYALQVTRSSFPVGRLSSSGICSGKSELCRTLHKVYRSQRTELSTLVQNSSP